jgi:hypothetical protein
MFYGCTSLNYIKALFTTTPSDSYTQNWVNGVASSGTFVKNSNATWNVTGVDGIPTGWTVELGSPQSNNAAVDINNVLDINTQLPSVVFPKIDYLLVKYYIEGNSYYGNNY